MSNKIEIARIKLSKSTLIALYEGGNIRYELELEPEERDLVVRDAASPSAPKERPNKPVTPDDAAILVRMRL